MGINSKFHKAIGAVEVVVGGILDYFGFTQLGNSLILIGIATWKGVPGMPVPIAAAMRANLASPITPLQIVYGATRVGGVLVACDSGNGAGDTDADYKYYAVALSLTLKTGSTSALAIEGVPATPNGFWYVDQNPIDDACVNHSTGAVSGSSAVGNFINYDNVLQLMLHKGDQTTADSWLTGGLSYWTSAYIGHGIAYLVAKIHVDPTTEDAQSAFPNGLPQQLNVVIKGQKVYDPRLDTTAGGSGSHRKNDPTTWEYTHGGVDIGANPALCLRDYLVRPITEGGAGIDYTRIPDDYLTAAANACDASMTIPNGSGGTTTEATYQVGVGLSTGDSVPVNIQKLLDAMAGVMVQTSGQYRIIAGTYTAPATTINEDWLCGGPTLQVQAEQDTRFNTVDATFTDPASSYTEIQTPSFAAAGAVTADGGIVIPRHLNLPAVPNQYNAQYISSINANQSREQMRLSLPCNLKAMDVDCAEFVNVTIAEYGLSASKFRILNWQRKGDSSILLDLQQAKSTTYNVPTFTEVAPLGKPFTDNNPMTILNLTATAKPNGIHLEWDPAPAIAAVGYNVYISSDGGSTYPTVKTLGLHSEYVYKVTDGNTYYFKVKARNYRGKLSKNYSNIVNERAYKNKRTQATLTVAKSAAAAFYTVATIPGVGGVAKGTYTVRIGGPTISGSVNTPFGLHAHVHVEIDGNCGVTGTVGRCSSLVDLLRIRQATSGADANLELRFTGSGSQATVYTIDVEAFEGTYDASGVPVAVQDGTATTGSNILGQVDIITAKHFVKDSRGASNQTQNDGSTTVIGNTLTNSVGQVDNAERLHMWNPCGIGAMCTGNPLSSAHGAGSTGHIDVLACTYRRGGSAHDLSFSAVNNVVTGLADGAAGRYIYCDDTDNTAGSKSWSGTTSATTACNGDDRVCLGLSASIPVSGSTTGGAGNNPSTTCVDPEMWIDEDRQAKDLWWGSKVLCADGREHRVRPTFMEALWHLGRLFTGRWDRLFKPDIYVVGRCRIRAPGVEWIGSAGTPFDLQDGESVIAGMMYRRHVLKPDGSWCQVTEVESLDAGPVVRVHLGGQSFPAGLTPELRCMSHNTYKP